MKEIEQLEILLQEFYEASAASSNSPSWLFKVDEAQLKIIELFKGKQ